MIISFRLFPSYMNLIWACKTIKIQRFRQQLYWRIKYKKRYVVWFEISKLKVGFILSRMLRYGSNFFHSFGSKLVCLMVNRFSCHHLVHSCEVWQCCDGWPVFVKTKIDILYNLEQKQNLGKYLCLKYKLEAEAESKKHWDPKRKKTCCTFSFIQM